MTDTFTVPVPVPPSPERIYPDPWHADENTRRHIARYEFAASHIPAGATVLDCACGSGYGAEILAGKVSGAKVVVGVDKSAKAIDYALAHHSPRGVSYACQRLEDFRGGPCCVDAVVTLETLEHIPRDVCRRFLQDAGCWLRPGGVLVASSPMLRYRNGEPYITSPFHVNEMPRAELLAMFEELLPAAGAAGAAGWVKHYYHQEQEAFLPLLDEDTGFLVLVARKRS
jgi:2-polyprenyl-3-methyl-5-hydroxy-6-metoxy-1,4-benzoquinol methylase